MQNIVDWLAGFERTAAEFYIRAADYFSKDTELAELAGNLAQDELWHAEIMTSIAEYQIEHAAELVPYPSLVKVDVQSKEKIADLFSNFQAQFDTGTATKREFLSTIIEAEYSEWNTYLLYAVSTYKDIIDDFKLLPAKMQQHKSRIENYIASLGESEEADGLTEKIGRLPDLWTDHFLLVVDDESMILDLLKAVLDCKGVVDCAYNGEEALEKFKEKYYDVTITDVDMPVMGGMDFYNSIKDKYPNTNKRVLFFTGALNPERVAFFNEHSISYLTKPASIEEIVTTIDLMLKHSPKYGAR